MPDADGVAAAARGFEGPLRVRVESRRQRPPRLHDLPLLQKLASARFGWSASKTLEVAQELYDGAGKKILTYPRADVRYLPESVIVDVAAIVAGLCAGRSYAELAVPSPPVIRRGRNGAFHDKGLEGASHHAMVPNVNTIGDLHSIWPRLSKDEKRLFDVVARSYLASVMPDYRYRQTTVTMDVGGHEFGATGHQALEAGWRAAFPHWRPEEEKGEASQTLPGVGGVTIRTEEALGASAQRPPTAAMRKLAAAIARHKSIKAPAGYTKSAAVCRAFLDRHAPQRDPGEGAGCGVRRRRRICASVGRGRAEGEAGAPANQGRRGEAQIVRTGPGGFRGGHAASHPLRQQGGCVEAGSEVRRGRLVRAAGRRPQSFPGAGLAVVVHDAADAALAVATIRSGTGGARARARDTWSGGKTACGGRDARRGGESARPATGALPRCVH